MADTTFQPVVVIMPQPALAEWDDFLAESVERINADPGLRELCEKNHWPTEMLARGVWIAEILKEFTP